MPRSREVRAVVHDALAQGLGKTEVRHTLADRFEADDLERALERHADPRALVTERHLQRGLTLLFAGGLVVKVLFLLDVARHAAAADQTGVARVSLALAAGWSLLFLVIAAFLLRASVHGYTGVLGWSAASLGYSGVSLATASRATDLQLTLFVFDVAFALCTGVLAVFLWRALYGAPHAR